MDASAFRICMTSGTIGVIIAAAIGMAAFVPAVLPLSQSQLDDDAVIAAWEVKETGSLFPDDFEPAAPQSLPESAYAPSNAIEVFERYAAPDMDEGDLEFAVYDVSDCGYGWLVSASVVRDGQEKAVERLAFKYGTYNALGKDLRVDDPEIFRKVCDQLVGDPKSNRVIARTVKQNGDGTMTYTAWCDRFAGAEWGQSRANYARLGKITYTAYPTGDGRFDVVEDKTIIDSEEWRR